MTAYHSDLHVLIIVGVTSIESEQEDCAVPLPPMSPDPVFPEPVRESQLSRGKGKGEVVKTYRRAVYQVFISVPCSIAPKRLTYGWNVRTETPL